MNSRTGRTSVTHLTSCKISYRRGNRLAELERGAGMEKVGKSTAMGEPAEGREGN